MKKKRIDEFGGRIVQGVNTTSDINIHSIKQQAKKFGNDVSDDGDPLYNIAEYFKYLKESIDNDINELLENEKRTEQLLSNPKFINWFKGSKVVDESGLPLVCYHGTKSIFDEFNTLSHFGTNKAANEFVNSIPKNDEHYNIIPVYLSIKNPLKIEDENNYSNDLGFDLWKHNYIDFDELVKVYNNSLLINNKTVSFSSYIKKLINDTQNSLKKLGYNINDKFNIPVKLNHEGYKIDNDKLINIIKEKGYDGFVYKNKSEDYGSISWVIFNSNQVWPIFKN